MTTGTSGTFSRSRVSVPMPSISPGIMRSRRMASGSSSMALAAPAAPSAASRTVNPSAESSAPTMRRMFGSSSMIRIVDMPLHSPGGLPAASLRAARRALGQELGHEALPFAEPLHLTRHGLDGALESGHALLQPLHALGIAIAPAVQETDDNGGEQRNRRQKHHATDHDGLRSVRRLDSPARSVSSFVVKR